MALSYAQGMLHSTKHLKLLPHCGGAAQLSKSGSKGLLRLMMG
jgi:hypothetical protein